MEEKTYQQMGKEFQEVFFLQLSPQLERYESKRKGYLLCARIVSGILLLIGFVLLILVFTQIRDVDVARFVFKLTIGIFLFAVASWHFIKKRFENSIKEKCMPILCQCFGDLEWSSGEYYERGSIFLDSNLLDKYDDETYDDIFKGSHKGVEIEIIESNFTKGSGSDSKTLFEGVIIKLKMNKRFSGNTVIRPDSMMHFSPSPRLKHTILEDVVFEKNFDVFTDDEVEARYLITPSFMERLNNMQTAFKAESVSCSFYDEYLLIGLETSEDLFSVGNLKKPVNDDKQFFTMFEEILSIIKLIDHFKLDQKIGL